MPQNKKDFEQNSILKGAPILTRRQALALITGGAIVLTPSIAKANPLQKLKKGVADKITEYAGEDSFIGRQAERYLGDNKFARVEIPEMEWPPFFVKDFERIGRQKGKASIWSFNPSSRHQQYTKVDEISVLAKLSKAETTNAKIKYYQLEIELEDKGNRRLMNLPEYPTHLKPQRNINGSQSSLWVCHPLLDEKTRSYNRVMSIKQDSYIITREQGDWKTQWQQGTPYDQDYKAQALYWVGEKTLDQLINLITPDKDQQEYIQKSLEKLVKWMGEEQHSLYQIQARQHQDNLVATQIPFDSPKLAGYTQEGIIIDYATFSQSGSELDPMLIGNFVLGDPSKRGGFVRNWELTEGKPFFI